MLNFDRLLPDPTQSFPAIKTLDLKKIWLFLAIGQPQG
jgi:hypothetical protein